MIPAKTTNFSSSPEAVRRSGGSDSRKNPSLLKVGMSVLLGLQSVNASVCDDFTVSAAVKTSSSPENRDEFTSVSLYSESGYPCFTYNPYSPGNKFSSVDPYDNFLSHGGWKANDCGDLSNGIPLQAVESWKAECSSHKDTDKNIEEECKKVPINSNLCTTRSQSNIDTTVVSNSSKSNKSNIVSAALASLAIHLVKN